MDYNHNGKIDKEDLIIEEEMNQPNNTINGTDAIKGFVLVILGLVVFCFIMKIVIL